MLETRKQRLEKDLKRVINLQMINSDSEVLYNHFQNIINNISYKLDDIRREVGDTE